MYQTFLMYREFWLKSMDIFTAFSSSIEQYFPSQKFGFCFKKKVFTFMIVFKKFYIIATQLLPEAHLYGLVSHAPHVVFFWSIKIYSFIVSLTFELLELLGMWTLMKPSNLPIFNSEETFEKENIFA